MFEKTRGVMRRFGPSGAAAGTGLLVLTRPAHAAIDVANVVTAIGDAATPIGLVAAAVLIIVAGVKAWKLVRSAM